MFKRILIAISALTVMAVPFVSQAAEQVGPYTILWAHQPRMPKSLCK